MKSDGILVGKFLPLHRGHLTHIFNSYSQCENLNIVICSNKKLDVSLCKEAGIKYISPDLRMRWLIEELKGFNNIKIFILNEDEDTPDYPDGWESWSNQLKNLIFQNSLCKEWKNFAIFTGEKIDIEFYKHYFPSAEVYYFDYSLSRYPISATQIRKEPLKYWDYICGSARSFFAKKILITGTESTGKTSLTKMLAKIFHTSWAEEAGRIYVEQNVKDERYITDQDYLNIINTQIEYNNRALKTCNKICFFDTDIIVTYYYYLLYKQETNSKEISKEFENLFKSIYETQYKDLYDYKFFMSSKGVRWVDDGLRQHFSNRSELDITLFNHYNKFNSFDLNFVDGNYNNRFTTLYKFCRNLIDD